MGSSRGGSGAGGRLKSVIELTMSINRCSLAGVYEVMFSERSWLQRRAMKICVICMMTPFFGQTSLISALSS